MGQRHHPAKDDDYLIAKALFVAINMYDLFPDEMRPQAERDGMERLLQERYPEYAEILTRPEPDAWVM